MVNKRYIYSDTDTVSICALFDNTRMPHRLIQIQIPNTYGSNKHKERQEMGLKTENWVLGLWGLGDWNLPLKPQSETKLI